MCKVKPKIAGVPMPFALQILRCTVFALSMFVPHRVLSQSDGVACSGSRYEVAELKQGRRSQRTRPRSADYNLLGDGDLFSVPGKSVI